MDIISKLPIVSLIWIIAAGFLVFMLLFLLGKRQIMRFTLKSRRGPYVSVGSNAPKSMRAEITRRLERVPEIKHEPKLLNPTIEQAAKSSNNHYYYRMKAVDAFTKFDECLRQDVPAACRHPKYSMRDYLTTIYPVYLSTAPPELINRFLTLYEHARHKPELFEESEYLQYEQALDELVECLEQGIKMKNEANIEQMKQLPTVDTEVKLKSSHKGIGKTKTSIPYNHMTSDKHSSRGQTRYRTRANSSEQAGLLESAPSSQRSSIEGLVTAHDSSENVRLVEVNMNTMPT
ncbi:protein C1orf43 homolog [Mya arenaria]|uniref:protein C1orf43 homolog n=1 Tax=Mya arenaria TaxID=6604 RepID=UPI0022DF8C65|nr:protein C1orf43 homolog [Mya arenaria]XP_052796635.1 protein C1orf43 homolog [Mya arenaria]